LDISTKLRGLDLFSGIGGISRALEPWVRTIAYCENDRYCQGVLLSNMQRGGIDRAPIWDDIRSLSADMLPPIDIIFGGFPCTDISVAGVRKGLAGERSGLFFEIVRLAKEIKPSFIFLENVRNICSLGGVDVVREITEMGYDCRWCVISAASIGASHKRERWFLLGYAKHLGSYASSTVRSSQETVSNSEKGADQACKSERTTPCRVLATEPISNTFSERLEDTRLAISSNKDTNKPYNSSQYFGWKDEPEDKLAVVGVVNAVPKRLDRVRALGNSVVSDQVTKAFEILSGLISSTSP
jgi:DNA (cytosine-5)-methyltransferase 1